MTKITLKWTSLKNEAKRLTLHKDNVEAAIKQLKSTGITQIHTNQEATNLLKPTGDDKMTKTLRKPWNDLTDEQKESVQRIANDYEMRGMEFIVKNPNGEIVEVI